MKTLLAFFMLFAGSTFAATEAPRLALPQVTAHGLLITFTASPSSVDSYSVYRSVGPGITPTLLISGLSNSSLAYLDSTVMPNVSYNYAVTGTCLGTNTTCQGESILSNIVTGSITVATSIVISTTSFPSATVGKAYTTTLTASGGTPPYTWTATGIPAGLKVSGSTITGTPTTVGTFSTTLTVKDSASNSTQLAVPFLVTGNSNFTMYTQCTPACLSLKFSGNAGPQPNQTLIINDSTPAALPLAISTDQKWLSVTPTVTHTKATLTVSVDSTGMAPGSYAGNVIVTESAIEANGDSVNNSPLSVPITLTVTGPTPTLSINCPAAKAGITTNLPAGTSYSMTVTAGGLTATCGASF